MLSEIAVFSCGDVRLRVDGMQREKRAGCKVTLLSRLRAPGVKLINLGKRNVTMKQTIRAAPGHMLKCCSL